MENNFEEYLERFATSHRMTRDEAEQLAVVQEIKKFFEEELEKNQKVT